MLSQSEPLVCQDQDAFARHETVYVLDKDIATQRIVVTLAATLGIDCIAYSSTEECLLAGVASRPGCLVLDIASAGLSGLDLQKKLQSKSPAIPLIFLSTATDVSTVVQCMEYGAFIILEKPVNSELLERAIRQALIFDHEQCERAQRLEELRSIDEFLSNREREVLHRIIEGQLNKKIARELQVSERTIENVRSRLMQKFAACNATVLAAKYTEYQMLKKFADRIGPRRNATFPVPLLPTPVTVAAPAAVPKLD